MKKTISLLIALSFLAFGCNKHFMTQQMLTEQLDKEYLNSLDKKLEINYNLFEFARANYNANGLYRILCIEKKSNKKVFLYINKDTTLVLTDNSGEKHRLYFDTIRIEKNSVIGLKSRFIRKELSYVLSNISKLEIHAELSKIEPAN